MKYFTDILRIVIISGVITLPGFLGAQRSSAELITSILPPVIDSDVQVNDGARQLVLFDNYLLITNFWAGLQLYDITDIENPSRVAFAPTDDDANYAFVDENYAYLANHSAGVRIYEIPQLSEVARVRTPGNAYSVVAEYPLLYVALGRDGFSIIDIRDMFNPAFLSLEIPGTWVQYLVKRDNLLFVAAKKGGMMIYDISDPESPRMLSQYKTGYDVMMIQLEGDRAFLADGAGGVVVMNIAHPEFPEFILRFNDGGYVQSIFKYGNYVYLANQSKGLEIVNISDLKKPFLEGSYQTDSQAYTVLKRNIYVFLTANKSTLILRHNNDPVLEDIADLNLNEGEMFQLQLKAREPDGDPFVFHAYNLPEGSKFDTTTGLFSWTPSYEKSGIYPDVVFKVTEKTISRLSVTDTVTITVRHINRPPDLPAIKDTSVAENKLLTIVLPQGSDPDIEDQGRLSYSAERLPEGAEFDPITRTFSWKPTFEQSGTYIIDFVISDSAGGFDREPVTITVYHVDRKPALEMIPGQEVHENEGLALKISGEDPDKEDQDKISFKILNLPEGAQFDADNQTLSWTPTFDQSGEYSGIQVVMVAGDLSDTTAFDIKVIHVNRPPQLMAIEDKTINENEILEFSIEGNDPDREDAGKLKFSAQNLPDGASFDSTALTFRWMPTFEQSGDYVVTFSVMDSAGLAEEKPVNIAVSHVNRPPQLEPVADRMIDENQPLSIQLVGSDPDKEDAGNLRFVIDGLPEGAIADTINGLLNWTPDFDQSGQYRLTAILKDGAGGSAKQSFTITVNNVNRPPAFEALTAPEGTEGSELRIGLTARDPDEEDEGKLEITPLRLPEGAQFNAATGEIVWTPTFEQSGSYEIEFQVRDSFGASDNLHFSVGIANLNRPPQIESPGNQSVAENQNLTFEITGSDPDQEDQGKLVFNVTGLPDGASFNPQTRQFSWTPAFDQSGVYELTFDVMDSFGESATTSVLITVSNVNRPPQIVSPGPQSGEEGQNISFVLTATDPDKEDQGHLKFSALNLPEGASFDEKSGQFSWTPGYEQSGNYVLKFQVSDAGNEVATVEVTLGVKNVNRSPELKAPGERSVQEGQSLKFKIIAEDPDKEDENKLKVSATGLPPGVEFNPETGEFFWIPGYDQQGEYDIEFSTKDASGTPVKTKVSIRVIDVPEPDKTMKEEPK